MKTGIRLCVIIACSYCLTGIGLRAQAKLPSVFLIDASSLFSAQLAYKTGDGEFKDAIDALLRDAATALKVQPGSVMQKPEAPPSGDKHDYMSVAPYWWPDTTQPTEVPYVRRDGVVNPEHDIIGDRVCLGRMIGTVRTLALAYFITRNEVFAEHAVTHLRVWFLDDSTRMNPHLRFAQAIKGVVDGRGIGIIDTHGFRDLVDAMQLLRESANWTETIDRGMRDWFSAYLHWLTESPNGKEESTAKNNHGTTYDVQVASIALYLGEREKAKEIALAAGEKRIAVQVMPDGSQPLELERTKSWGYSMMNAEALVNLALLAAQVGVDLWHFTTPDGRSIGKAIDFLLPFTLQQKEWSHEQIAPMDHERMVPILNIAAVKFGEVKYHSAYEKILNPKIRASRMYLLLPKAATPSNARTHREISVDIAVIDRSRIMQGAEHFLNESPLTITAFSSPRSAGGIHEYFSEGDYWWPDPKNPDGPYIQRDGLTNPDNFIKHREAMQSFCTAVSTLAAAYKITHDERFAARAVRHLKAWFVDDSTMMYPHLKYAQAIKGRVTGRGIGIIDTIHLIEVARTVEVLSGCPSLAVEDESAIKRWFAEYLTWMTTHQYGIDERETKNNHATWWVAQAAVFAHLVKDSVILSFCRARFKAVLLPNQMGPDGSFPEELRRTKPYNYSLFNMEGMALICWVLSTAGDNLWEHTLTDGRNMRRGMEFLYPYIVDKSKWPYPKDVMYFEHYPGRQPSLLLAGIALNEQKYIEAWKKLDPDPTNAEVRRSIPIRQPVLWTN